MVSPSCVKMYDVLAHVLVIVFFFLDVIIADTHKRTFQLFRFFLPIIGNVLGCQEGRSSEKVCAISNISSQALRK